jgi:hypothetical protein
MDCSRLKSAGPGTRDHHVRGAGDAATKTKDKRPGNHFSFVPLLLFSRDISDDARRALVESRFDDAAELLMQEHGLSCIEAGDLLDVSVC